MFKHLGWDTPFHGYTNVVVSTASFPILGLSIIEALAQHPEEGVRWPGGWKFPTGNVSVASGERTKFEK